MGLLSKFSLGLIFASGICFAQLPIGIGVKAGVPITDSFNSVENSGTTYFSDSKNYIVGPMVELRLPFHLAVEADALYRPLNVAVRTTANGNTVTASSDSSSWEFPVLAKYNFSFPIAHPYIEAGPSFRTLGNSIGNLSGNGITFGAGVDVHALLLHVSPEFRYTHWGSDSSRGPANVPASSKQDQVEFLVGFSF